MRIAMNSAQESTTPGRGVVDTGNSSSLSDSNSPPPRIAEYELLRWIGGGSYGEVWLARSVLGDYRAVKIVYRRNFEHDRPYEREFEGIGKYEPISRTHESQVDILHVGRNDAEGHFYYVMELADDASGESGIVCERVGGKEPPRKAINPHSYVPKTLASLLRSPTHSLTGSPTHHGRLPADQCIEIGLTLTAALGDLHASGLVHRDVKPSNIIFVGGVPKLADIGLVAAAGEARSVVGTEGYMDPSAPGTPQADLYSLGRVLYEISMGRKGQSFPNLPPDWDEIPDQNRLLELNEVILKACQGDLRIRYPSAKAMRAELELLHRGKSVQQKRMNEQRGAAIKKTGLACGVLAVIIASTLSLRRQFTHYDFAGEGPPSTNDYATALSDKAFRIMRVDNYAAFAEAYTNFNKAIALDPNYARPYLGLVDLRTGKNIPSLPPLTPAELRGYVGKLEELAPNLAQTHGAQAFMSFFDFDFPQAQKRVLQAIEEGSQTDTLWYGFMLTHWGRPEEARRQLEIARTFMPSSAILYRMMGHTYYAQRHYTNAIAWYRRSLNFDQHEVASEFIGQAYRALGDYTNAFDTFEKAEIINGAGASETKRKYDRLRQVFEADGEHGYWEEQWKRTEKKPTSDFYWKAVIQIHLGDTNAAIAWLNRSFDTGERTGVESPLIDLLFDEHWDGLHDDWQFKKLLEEIGFTKVMSTRRK